MENPFLSPEVICLASFNPCVYLQCVKRKIHSLLLCCWQSDMLTYVHSAHFVMENSFMAALKSLLTQSSDSPRPASRSLPTPCFIHTFPTLQFPSSPLYLDLLLGAAPTAPSFYFYHFWMLHLLTTPYLLQESIWYKYFTKVKKKSSLALFLHQLFRFLHINKLRGNSKIGFFPHDHPNYQFFLLLASPCSQPWQMCWHSFFYLVKQILAQTWTPCQCTDERKKSISEKKAYFIL